MSAAALRPGRYTPEPAAPVWFVLFPHALASEAPPRWWQRPLRPGFRHVLAAQAVGDAQSLLAEHLGERLRLMVHAEPIGLLLRRLRDQMAALILAARDPATEPARARLRPFLTCVELIKALLGIRRPLLITPRQLFRHLRAGGARLVA